MDKIMTKTIYLNTNLIFLRRRLKLSQEKFGRLFDLSKGQILSYETSLHQQKIESLIKISDHFKISIQELILTNLNTQTNEKQSSGSITKSA